jgi:pilus assembly protein Flp/PilA
MVKQIVRFMKEEDGATAVEYGLMVALIAAIIVGVVTTVGTRTQNAFTTVSNALPAAS